MSSHPLHATASLRFARHLMARDATPEHSDPATAAAVLQRTVARVSEQLREALGEDARNALLARALLRTEKEHPPLRHIRRLDNDIIQLDGVATSVEVNGTAVVTAAVEALLTAIIDVLGRQLGEDTALRLIGHDATTRHATGAATQRIIDAKRGA